MTVWLLTPPALAIDQTVVPLPAANRGESSVLLQEIRDVLYDQLVKALETADADLLASIHHDDFQAIFHSSGAVMTKADMLSPEAIKWIESMKAEKQRCIYENDDILVMHNFVTYASGDQDAVMAVYLKKAGLIWRVESGATPIKG